MKFVAKRVSEKKKEIQSASDLHLSEYLSYLQFVVNFDYYEFNWVRLGAYGSKVVFPLATCRLTSLYIIYSWRRTSLVFEIQFSSETEKTPVTLRSKSGHQTFSAPYATNNWSITSSRVTKSSIDANLKSVRPPTSGAAEWCPQSVNFSKLNLNNQKDFIKWQIHILLLPSPFYHVVQKYLHVSRDQNTLMMTQKPRSTKLKVLTKQNITSR